jgi:hypothetical protein
MPDSIEDFVRNAQPPADPPSSYKLNDTSFSLGSHVGAVDSWVETVEPPPLSKMPKGLDAFRTTPYGKSVHTLQELMVMPPPGPESAPQMSSTGLSQEPASFWQGGIKWVEDQLTLGSADLNKAVAGWRLIANPDLEAADLRDEVVTQAVLRAQIGDEDYRNTHQYMRLFRMRELPWLEVNPSTGQLENDSFLLSDVPAALIKQIPFMSVTASGGLIGAAIGSLFGPGGTVIGGLGGSTLMAGLGIAGSHTYDMMEQGVHRDTAIAGGLTVGAISGVANIIGFGALAKASPAAARAVFSSSTFRQALAHSLKLMGRAFGIDVASGGVQAAADSTARYFETRSGLNAPGVQPFTIADGVRAVTEGIIQQSIIGASLGAGSTALGAATGFRAVQLHADRLTAEALHTEQLTKAKLLEDHVKALQEAEQKAALDATIKQEQLASRKQLKGFLEVNKPLEISAAADNLETAKANFEQAAPEEKVSSANAVRLAEAELKQARYAGKVESLEAALTDPELVARISERKQDLEKHIGYLENNLAYAESPSDRLAIQGQLMKAKADLTEVNRLAALGSEEKVRLELMAQKAQLEKYAHQSKLEVARAALVRRIDNRAKTIKSLKGFIREMKAEAKAEGDEAHTADKRARLEQLKEQQELDQVLLGMVDDGSIAAGDLNDLTPQTPTKRLTGLVELAKKQVDRAANQMGKARGQSMKAAKKLLDTVIDHSRLPKADRDALKASYAVLDVKKLMDVLPELQAKIEKKLEARRLEAARADLKSLLDHAVSNPKEVSKTPGTEEKLRTIKAFADDHEAIDRLMLELQGKPELSNLELAQIELADLFLVPLKEMTAPQIERIIDNVVSLRETGKAEALRRLQEIEARQAKKLEAFWQKVTPTEKGEARLQANHAKLRKMWDENYSANLNSFPGLMTVLSQFGEVSEMADILPMKEAESRFHAERVKWENRFKELLADVGISDKDRQKFYIKSHKKGEALKYSRPWIEGEQQGPGQLNKLEVLEHENGEPLSYAEMIQVFNYLRDKDPDAISRLKYGNKFSYPGEVPQGTSTAEVIEAHLDEHLPGWQKVADTMMKFYGEFHEVVDESAFRRFGRNITKNDTYGGKLLTDTTGSGQSRELFRRMSTIPGSAKQRQGGTAPVKIRSAMENLTNHIEEFTHEKAFSEFEQDAVALFRDKDVRKFIKRNIGENTLKAVDKHIDDAIFGYRKTYEGLDKALAWIRNSMYTAFLGARPEQAAKQLSGFVHGLQFVSPADMIDGYAYMVANPKGAKEMMSGSGLLQARTQLRDPDYHPSATSQLKRFNQVFMKPVEVGDHGAIYLSSFPVLLKTLRETGDAHAAMRAFERAFDTTQSSGSVSELPQIFRGNAAVRLLTVMAQEPTRQVEAINIAWRRFRNEQTPAAFAHYLRIAGVTWAGAALYNMLGYLLALPFMTSGKEAEDKALRMLYTSAIGPFSGVAILGGMLTNLAVTTGNLVFNTKTKAYEPSLMPTDVLRQWARAKDSLMKIGREGGDAEDYWNAMMAAFDAVGGTTGIPLTNMVKKFKPLVVQE